jgi:hypothetical protein
MTPAALRDRVCTRCHVRFATRVRASDPPASSCVDAGRDGDRRRQSVTVVACSSAFREQPNCRGRNQTMETFPRETMRISFATASAARAAASILEQYGFSANQSGKEVVTNCPTLLAAPAIERSIGLELVEGIEFSNGGQRSGTS